MPLKWENQCYVAVVLASGGYPGSYETGFAISGAETPEETAMSEGTMLFHAATRQEYAAGETQLLTSGGRVMTVVGRGDSLAEARATAYHRVQEISFQGAYYRTDIAAVEGRSAVWVPGPATPAG